MQQALSAQAEWTRAVRTARTQSPWPPLISRAIQASGRSRPPVQSLRTERLGWEAQHPNHRKQAPRLDGCSVGLDGQPIA